MSSTQLWLIAGLLLIFVYFSRLFFPTPQFFYTPEFLRSDNWHQNYPFKEFLSQSLKSGQLPVWNKYMGTGYPLLAEGQIGTFYIPNLILFGLLPTWLAWNLSIITIFITNFVGMYWLLLDQKHTPLASFLGASIYTFAGFFAVHLVHFNHLQVMSLLPWVFWAVNRLTTKPTITRSVVLAVILSQQLMAGHLQYLVITLIGVVLFVLTYRPHKKTLSLLSLSCLVAGGLSAIQLLPTLDLITHSTRAGGVETQTIFQFPLNVDDLLAIVSPWLTGNPFINNYSFPQSGRQGIYWENITYLGTIPFFLVLMAVFKIKRSKPWPKFLIFTLTISLLLALGQNSPLSVVHTLPGFNYFRLPSRYLLLTTFALASLATLGFDRVVSASTKKSLIPGLILTGICLLDLWNFNLRLHPLTSVKEVVAPPEIIESITPNSRISINPSTSLAWQDNFIAHGWQITKPFINLKNSLIPNQSILYNLTSLEYYAAVFLPRANLYQGLQTVEALNAQATEYIISATPLALSSLELVKTLVTTKLPNSTIHLYKNTQSLPRFRFVTNYIPVTNYHQAIETTKTSINWTNTAVLETNFQQPLAKLGENSIEVVSDNHTQLVLKTTTFSPAFLVIADTYDHNWQATINNQQTEIIPANLNQRAVLVPGGENTITFIYKPQSLFTGSMISGATIVFSLLVIVSSQRQNSSDLRLFNNFRRFF